MWHRRDNDIKKEIAPSWLEWPINLANSIIQILVPLLNKK